MTWEGTPELDAVLARARKLLEANGMRVQGAVSVPQGSDVPDLHRLRKAMGVSATNSATPTIKFPLAKLDEYLRGPGYGRRGLLTVLTEAAPLVDRKADAAAQEETDDRALAEVREILGDPRHRVRLDSVEAARGRKTALRTGSAREAALVLAALPAPGLSLTELAESATGNTKALSKASATRTLVLRALADEVGVEEPTNAEERNWLWAEFGVVADALSSRVSVFGVRLLGDHPMSGLLDVANRDRQPCVLTLGQIRDWSLELAPGDVFVCENPAVLNAAARELGPACPPLVCTEGQPTVAARRLLASVRGTVHWRGDFDWTGLRTTARAIADLSAQPWLMDAATYLHASKLGRSEPLKEKDRPAASPWEPELAEAMHVSGAAVMEERLIPALLESLVARRT